MHPINPIVPTGPVAGPLTKHKEAEARATNGKRDARAPQSSLHEHEHEHELELEL
jgi:hypothetical protein